ncbi:hypothetical protein SAMN06265368_2510 [Cohaesibacter gelatinilyticus]|uniref:Uncharacterized protein n=1 Tax=Cohaesibacter gelatinilyticus TaxID=372072 RepID=A0A285PCF5_9HYPH|nr:hypothetical protein SAMN06265368_2510 [Cohaesibacter gelatinilyticus]
MKVITPDFIASGVAHLLLKILPLNKQEQRRTITSNDQNFRRIRLEDDMIDGQIISQDLPHILRFNSALCVNTIDEDINGL